MFGGIRNNNGGEVNTIKHMGCLCENVSETHYFVQFTYANAKTYRLTLERQAAQLCHMTGQI